MKLKNILLSFLILISTSIYCAKIQAFLENKEVLARSLYNNEIDLSSLGPEAIILEMQNLKEQRAVLKHMIRQEIGFFNNYDMLKGLVGTYFGAGFLLASIRCFCISIGGHFIISHSIIKQSTQSIRSVTTIIPDRLTILVLPSACLLAFSLWLLKRSFTGLQRGWHKKTKTMEKLAKIENLLAQYNNYLS